MKEPFDWYHSLYYGEKWNLSDFDTKNPKSLDALLKQLFMRAHRTGNLKMKNSLPALNAAYYVAVCVANTEGIDETNLDEEIDSSIKVIWEEDYSRHHKRKAPFCPFAERMLIKWMAYAILYLQEKKSEEMNEFLSVFESTLLDTLDDVNKEEPEEWDNTTFLSALPKVIEEWEYRYDTDLRPHALHPKCYTDSMWTNAVRHYSLNELKWQLTFFHTQQEQKDFLNWAKEMSAKPQPVDAEELPF